MNSSFPPCFFLRVITTWAIPTCITTTVLQNRYFKHFISSTRHAKKSDSSAVPPLSWLRSHRKECTGLKRLQFPVRLAFCMTINKSQGQTLKKVGVFLPAQVFAHGPLYVVLSRVGSLKDLCVKIMNNNTAKNQVNEFGTFTKNVVYNLYTEE